MVKLEGSVYCGSDEEICIQFCAHVQAESPFENLQAENYCIPEAMCIGRRI